MIFKFLHHKPDAKSESAKPTSVKPPRSKIYINMLRFGVVIAIMTLLFNGPRLFRTLSKSGERATCTNEKAADYKPSTIKDVVLGRDLVQQPKVLLDGTITYSGATDTFFLRDGAMIVPLDLSGCQSNDIFKRGDVLVFIKGTASVQDGRSRIAVDGIHLSAPTWAQIMYNAGVFIVFGLFFWFFIIAIQAIVATVRWLLVLIGLRQPKKPKIGKTLEEIKERDAGLSLIIGLVGPVLWAINPILGAAYQGYGLYLGWQGLHSHKRVVALIGIVLGVCGLIIMPLLLGSLGMFAKTPEPNFYHNSIENF